MYSNILNHIKENRFECAPKENKYMYIKINVWNTQMEDQNHYNNDLINDINNNWLMKMKNKDIIQVSI